MLAIPGWTFATVPGPNSYTALLLILIHGVMGLSTAGVTLAGGYIGMKLAPRETAKAQLAVIGVVNSFVAGVAPALVGLCVDFFAARELAWKDPSAVYAVPTLSLQDWDFFVLAFAIGLFSLHRLACVRESGERDRSIVVHRSSRCCGRCGTSPRSGSSAICSTFRYRRDLRLKRRGLERLS
ncbi:MAG: hypothetical protein QMC96_02295 [Methanomicrobiales archaeon]|nr:hypothetical protein [Methanomicrobiales archaeon]